MNNKHLMIIETVHKPVLKKEVIEYLEPQANENFIDATVDGGGHTFEIIEKTKPNGKLLGIEWDKEIFNKLKLKIKERNLERRIILANDNFKNLKEIVKKKNFKEVSGILFDLGFSSWHIEKSKKGFSFLKDEFLDMRYGNGNLRAMDILNKWQEKDIERILREYGGERFSRKIARAIIEERKKEPILKTSKLVEIIKKVLPYKKGRIHPATRTFQALRIAVNQELENLKEVLSQVIEILKPGGKIVVISFHSLEDRIVKNFFKEEKQKGRIEILTKKPLVPTRKEIFLNPRARSAKLRVAKVI